MLLLCTVFNPLTILLCLNGIREATRELYCQAHHGNTSALKTYQLLGALTHCLLSSPRSSFPCCLHAPGCLAIPEGPPKQFSLRWTATQRTSEVHKLGTFSMLGLLPLLTDLPPLSLQQDLAHEHPHGAASHQSTGRS